MRKEYIYHSLAELGNLAEKTGHPLWETILRVQMQQQGVSRKQCLEQMQQMYLAMKQADASYDGKMRSTSGLTGTDGEKLHRYNSTGQNLAGPFMGMVMEKALKMGESNACMKRIVAAPTAGSCGVIPAVLLSWVQTPEANDTFRSETVETPLSAKEQKAMEALFICAGIGSVIAENASIAGASGGCQAEIGSASAMAAAGLAYLQGGDNQTIFHAAAMALKNMLGLTCDPVGGLVEVPCIKRNCAGAVNAVMAAQMSLAGIRSVIPPDEVIDAMRRIGDAMPASLKETAEGGLAASPTAQSLLNP